jgi:hypothetical protein
LRYHWSDLASLKHPQHSICSRLSPIIKHAQGVFLWVQLVGKELLDYYEEGYAEDAIFQFLKSLPIELEEFYACMLRKMGEKERNLQDGVKMFQFVLFACRPLTVDELLHSIGTQSSVDADEFVCRVCLQLHYQLESVAAKS